LGDQFFYVAETLDDVGGTLVVDMDDDAQGEKGFVGVFGNEVDGF
jgi:hypothetical protein